MQVWFQNKRQRERKISRSKGLTSTPGLPDTRAQAAAQAAAAGPHGTSCSGRGAGGLLLDSPVASSPKAKPLVESAATPSLIRSVSLPDGIATAAGKTELEQRGPSPPSHNLRFRRSSSTAAGLGQLSQLVSSAGGAGRPKKQAATQAAEAGGAGSPQDSEPPLAEASVAPLPTRSVSFPGCLLASVAGSAPVLGCTLGALPPGGPALGSKPLSVQPLPLLTSSPQLFPRAHPPAPPPAPPPNTPKLGPSIATESQSGAHKSIGLSGAGPPTGFGLDAPHQEAQIREAQMRCAPNPNPTSTQT